MRKVLASLVIVAMLFSSCSANYTHGNTVTVDISEYDTSAEWYVSAEYVSVLIEIDSAEGGTDWTEVEVEDGNIVLDGLSSGYWIIQVKAETDSETVIGYGIVLVDGDVAAELEFTVEEATDTDGGEDDGGETGTDGGETGTGGDEDEGSGGSSGGSSEDDGSGSGGDEETAASTVNVVTLNDYSGMTVTQESDGTLTFAVTLSSSSPAWYVNNVSVDETLDSGLTAEASDDGTSLTVTITSEYNSSYLNVTCLETIDSTVTKYYADLILFS